MMDAYDVKLFRRRMNGIANVLVGVAFVGATIICAIAIRQQDWPWWGCGFAYCGIALFWSGLFYAVSKSPVDLS